MSSPGQKRGSCGHAMASFDGHAFCARCRDKGKGKDPCEEMPQSECKFCIVLTPDQLAQLATPSYKLKKEKREAKKLESTPSKDSSLVDPSTVAVIGAVSDSGTVTSPASVVPEKKAKKEKPSTSIAKKSTEKSPTDSKHEELDKKWTDHFNRLEALLMAKTLQPTVQPTFSSAVKVTPSHSPPATIPKDSEPFFQPTSTGHTGTDSCIYASVSQPARVGYSTVYRAHWKRLLLNSNSCPASSDPTNRKQDLPHPSTLVLTHLLSISKPASLNLSGTDQDLLLLGALAVTPLFPNISQPASLTPTGTDTQDTLVLTPLPPDTYLLANLSPTDQSLHWPLTPAHLHCIDRDRTVFLV